MAAGCTAVITGDLGVEAEVACIVCGHPRAASCPGRIVTAGDGPIVMRGSRSHSSHYLRQDIHGGVNFLPFTYLTCLRPGSDHVG